MAGPNQRRLMFVINQSPQASPAARERLDQVLMALAFDQEVRVVFVADGVWQLLSGQTPGASGVGGFAVGYKSLALYGVAAVLVEYESLEERGIDAADLLMPVEKQRFDAILVARGLAASRTQAQALLLVGRVTSRGVRVEKPGTRLAPEVQLEVRAGRT